METADPTAINLALKVQDEMVLYVPAIGEELPVLASPVQTGPAAGPVGGLVDINSATDAELMELPGIGPSKAAAIITYRTENGNFEKIEDLKDVTGIGDKSFEQLKDGITVR
ncbi:helix-hairpin-helix domain-containing protein [Planococcus koreensis]|uniref:helix-hairpin-helix domain-containing protein n=1 Tax=Planococcus koreensis TaxID=112331 RepID=UPI0039FD6688